MKKKRYWLIMLPGLLLAVFAFLPFILSTQSATRFLVAAVNKRTAGNLSIGSCLIGWQQGFLCKDVVYEDPRRGIRLSVPRLTGTQGLAEMLLTPGNLGFIAMDSPVLAITLPSAPRDEAADSSSRQTAAGGGKPAWEKFAAELQVRDGLVEMQTDAGGQKAALKNFTLRSRLSSGEVDYDLFFRPPAGRGDFAAEGRLNLPADSDSFLGTLYNEADIRIRDFQIRDYLSFAAQLSDLPTGEGTLTADFHFRVAGLEDFSLGGSAEVNDLKLAGGKLGGDTPSFQQISLTLEEVEWSKFYRRAGRVHLESDAGTVSCSGEYKDNRLQVNSRGNLSIPVLFDRFPRLLKVREEAFLESGTLEFTADMGLNGSRGKFDFVSRAENLGGLFDGRPFTWSNPVTAILHGENEGFDVKIRRLQVESPFFQAFGQGDLTAFDLEATADLGNILAEYGKLFEHPWTGSGELELSMDAASAGAGNLYTVNTDLNINHFSLSRQETVVVPNQHFSIVGSSSIPLSLLRKREGRFDLQFALSSWLGEIFFTVNGNRKQGGLTDARYSTDTNLQLGSLTRLLHALDFSPDDRGLSGELQVQAAGYIDGSVVGFDELNSRIIDFAYRNNRKGFSDRDVRFYIERSINDEIPSLVIHDLEVAGSKESFFRVGAGSNSIDLAASSLSLHDLTLSSDLGSIRLEELVLPDWRKPMDIVRAKGTVDADLQMLTPLLHGSSLLTDGLNLAGSGQLEFSTVDNDAAGKDIVADLQVKAFSVDKGGSQLLPPDDLRLMLRLGGEQPADRLTVEHLQFFSGPLDVKAGGEFRRSDKKRELDLQGTMTPRMEQVAGLLNNALDMDISMQGSGAREFAVQYRWTGREAAATGLTDFSTRVDADRIEYKGLRLSGISLPVSLEEKILQVQLQGMMNEGRVNVTAHSDFNQDPVILTVPENSRIMTDVQLNQPVVEGILQGIHPLFGILASPAGRLALRLDSFAWPVRPYDASGAVFTAAFDVSRINLDSSGLLRKILADFALEEEGLQLRDTEIRCSGSRGRISCSPVRFLAADSEMVLSGSVGMDKSLDYILEVPITRKLVSEEVYRFLEGSTVKVPISGTVGQPAYDKDMATAAIRDLVKQAAAKVVESQAKTLLPSLIKGASGKPGNK